MIKDVSNWGKYPISKSNELTFTLVDELVQDVAQQDGVIGRGNGRCYGDASLSSTILNTTKFDKILAFDIKTGVFDCQSGITLDEVLAVIVPHGWFLPVTPGTKYITVGGALASDVHGKNHHVDGTFSQHVTNFDLIVASGETLTVSTSSHPDLFEATAGGMGLTGMITRVRFRLKRIETAYIKQKQIKAANIEEILRLFNEYKDYTYSVAWIDCLQKGNSMGRSILMLGEHATEEEINEKQKQQIFATGSKRQLNFPINLPAFALNSLSIKAFNWLYYNKNTKKVQESVSHYEPFFYPLDAVLNWNRMYGKRGFVQYQFVLPLGIGKDGLVEILELISKKGLGSFLAVLKVFGKQESMISFPFEGYTLALDFPVSKALFPFLDELDKVVEAYGGRIYLSKDARMKADFFHRSYPRLAEFSQIIKKYDPQMKFRSLLSERLNIHTK